MEGFTGQTPGKMILGITVANMNGEKATIDKLLLRAFIKITGSFVGIIGFIIFVGCFLVLGEKKQAIVAFESVKRLNPALSIEEEPILKLIENEKQKQP